MIQRQEIIEISNLCEIFANGVSNGTITKQTYSDGFKEEHLKPFIEDHGNSPSQLIQEELRIFFEQELSGMDKRLNMKNFGFWGNNIYSYVWTCIYFHFGQKDLAASYSPQLYILVNRMGIKYGFCYGHQVTNDHDLVKVVKSGKIKFNISQLNEYDISFFNSGLHDITARPEVLFGPNERIILNSDNDLLSNWSNKSLLIKEYPLNEIPLNISEDIQNTLAILKEIFLSILNINNKAKSIEPHKFSHNEFQNAANQSGLFFSHKLIVRFVSSLLAKPFLLLTGLSGSGKTKLAQAFVQWICENSEQYRIVPVGADWTNREPLLGYPDGLSEEKYVLPDSGALQIMINAIKPENENKPHFLILDEMNLSHVERYFADFLSVMESHKEIKLYDGSERKNTGNDIPKEIRWPKNLFIIGTVNVDETTYMFSPKVLDRANVIEFRIEQDEMEEFLKNGGELRMEKLHSGDNEMNPGLGAGMATDFLRLAGSKTDNRKAEEALINFFPALQKAGAEFGYRSASEINRLAGILEKLLEGETIIDGNPISEIDFIDIAIMQKLLPKLHGSRNKLVPVMVSLGKLCLDNNKKTYPDTEDGEKSFIRECLDTLPPSENIKYRISFDKIRRMYLNVIANGFTSYAEN